MRAGFVVAALRNPISRIGVARTTASALLFLFFLAVALLGFLQNPYTGLVVFVFGSAFVLGLLLIPVGLWHERVSGPAWHPELRQAIAVTQRIYRRSMFPAMKVGWGTYPNQIGHTVSTRCFRCHDDAHKTTEGLAIRQDCELCHTIE